MKADRPACAYRFLKHRLGKLVAGHKRICLLTSRPQAGKLLNLLPWDRVFIDIEDPWLRLDWEPKLTIEKARQFASHAHRVFANGPRLAAEYSGVLQREVISLTNGVDDWFVEAVSGEKKEAPSFFQSAGGKLKAVFTGNLNERLDYDMLAELVSEERVHFYFVGVENIPPQHRSLWQRIRERLNVHCVPPVAHRQVPQILRHSDILLLPFYKGGRDQLFPAKLWEYIAAAKPILSSDDFGLDADQSASLVVCTTQESMKQRLCDIVEGRFQLSPEAVLQARSAAASNTWGARASRFLEIALS